MDNVTVKTFIVLSDVKNYYFNWLKVMKNKHQFVIQTQFAWTDKTCTNKIKKFWLYNFYLILILEKLDDNSCVFTIIFQRYYSHNIRHVLQFWKYFVTLLNWLRKTCLKRGQIQLIPCEPRKSCAVLFLDTL